MDSISRARDIASRYAILEATYVPSEPKPKKVQEPSDRRRSRSPSPSSKKNGRRTRSPPRSRGCRLRYSTPSPLHAFKVPLSMEEMGFGEEDLDEETTPSLSTGSSDRSRNLLGTPDSPLSEFSPRKFVNPKDLFDRLGLDDNLSDENGFDSSNALDSPPAKFVLKIPTRKSKAAPAVKPEQKFMEFADIRKSVNKSSSQPKVTATRVQLRDNLPTTFTRSQPYAKSQDLQPHPLTLQIRKRKFVPSQNEEEEDYIDNDNTPTRPTKTSEQSPKSTKSTKSVTATLLTKPSNIGRAVSKGKMILTKSRGQLLLRNRAKTIITPTKPSSTSRFGKQPEPDMSSNTNSISKDDGLIKIEAYRYIQEDLEYLVSYPSHPAIPSTWISSTSLTLEFPALVSAFNIKQEVEDDTFIDNLLQNIVAKAKEEGAFADNIVSRIIMKQNRKGKPYYLVEWEGMERVEDRTWEPAERLGVDDPEIVRVFEEGLSKKMAGLGRKKTG